MRLFGLPLVIHSKKLGGVFELSPPLLPPKHFVDWPELGAQCLGALSHTHISLRTFIKKGQALLRKVLLLYPLQMSFAPSLYAILRVINNIKHPPFSAEHAASKDKLYLKHIKYIFTRMRKYDIVTENFTRILTLRN